MKRILLSFLTIAAFLTVGQASAKVTIYNDTAFPIVAWVKYDGGYEDFPSGSVDKKGTTVFDWAVGMPSKSLHSRNQDVWMVKRWWKVWVKENGEWKLWVNKRWNAGFDVNATVRQTFDPDSGENNFDLEVIRGRRR